MNPSKRVAIVTGGVLRAGRASSRGSSMRMQVADELWLVARNEKALTDVAAELDTPARRRSGRSHQRGRHRQHSRTMLAARRPQVTFLVNAAGFGKFGDWQTISDAAVDSMIDLNCRGLVDMTRAALPYMERGSRIIQVASAAAFAPLAPHERLRRHQGLRAALHPRAALGAARNWHHRHGALPHLGEDRLREGGAHLRRRPRRGAPPRRANAARTWCAERCCANKAHFAVACASPQSAALRLIGKVVPSCITMAGWDVLRRL